MEDEHPFSKMGRIPEQFEKSRIIKNLVVMSSSMMLVFTAYDGLSMLQSTMNKEIGTVSQAMVYSGFCLSSLVLPKYAIKKLGCKVIFLIAATLFVPYIAANFYPSWFTLMSSALFLGVGSSMIWAAQTSYFNESVVLYCFLDGSTAKNKTNLNPASSCYGSEYLPNSNYNRRSIGVLACNNSNCTSVEVLSGVNSNSEILPEGNCIRVLAEINPHCTSADDFPEITPEIDNLEEYSRKATVLLKDEEFTSIKDHLVDNKVDNNFLVVNSKQQNEDVFPVTNLGFEYSRDVSKKFDCKTENDPTNISDFYDTHCSVNVNHNSNGLSSSTKIKFKGEITSDVKDIRSRHHLNKNKIVVSVISNVQENHGQSKAFESHDTIAKTLPTREIQSRLKVSNLENQNRKPTNRHDKIDVHYEYQNPRKSAGYIDVQQKFSNIESVTARFFGSNGLTFHSAQMWSNLVSYYVLQSDDSSGESACFCGASFCNAELECRVNNSEETGDDMKYLLTGISVVLAILAILLVLFLLDPLGTEKEPVEFSLSNLLATFHHCKKTIQLCLVPISLYIGMLQGFYTADFTKSYIACALGKSKVGLITIYYGLSCALSSTLSGYLVKYTGRIPIFLLVQLLNIAASVFLLVWTPDPEQQTMFYVTAVLLGMVTGILWSQIPALYGILFKKDEEAAFASYYLFNSLGWALSFVYSDYLCTSVKVYILLTVSSFGILGCMLTESMYRARKNRIGLAFA